MSLKTRLDRLERRRPDMAALPDFIIIRSREPGGEARHCGACMDTECAAHPEGGPIPKPADGGLPIITCKGGQECKTYRTG